jgi:hypothetical protein
MNLTLSLRSELLKTKRTSVFYLTLAAAAFGPLMTMLEIIFDEGVEGDNGKKIFSKMMIANFQITSFMVFPIFIILICTLLPQIEYKNNAWKQVLSSPQAKGNIFMAKFVNVQMMILLFLLLNKVMMFTGAVILHFKEPSLDVLNQPLDGNAIMMAPVNSYLALLALCSLQFWLGLRCKNFITPLGIGLALWLTGSILVMGAKSPLGEYFPYSFHVYGSFPQYKEQLANTRWISPVYATVFLVLAFLDFRKRRMSA